MANPFQGDDVDPFSGARNKAGETDPAKQESKAESKAEPKKQSFKSAFAAARKEGKKTFSWNGKKYTTELASSKSSAPKSSAPKSSTPKSYMSKKSDDDRAYRAPKMGEEGFMAKRMTPSEAMSARTSADYRGKSARDMNMGLRMDPMQAATAGIDENEKVGTYKRGGKVNEMKMMGRMGRGMAKADMQKKAYGGMMKGYAAGGMPMVEKDGKKVPAFAADGKGKMKSGGIASSLKAHASAPASKAHGKKMMGGGMAKYAKGGKVDGCAQRGKTKGRMV
jgi:hypothetical protein